MEGFKIKHEEPLPRIDQETTISYDRELDVWSLYTNVPTHARKWEDAVVASDIFFSVKIYHEKTGELIAISGEIDGTASVRKRRELTEEQKNALSERMKNLHKSQSE